MVLVLVGGSPTLRRRKDIIWLGDVCRGPRGGGRLNGWIVKVEEENCGRRYFMLK